MILIGRGLDFRYDLEPIGGSIRATAWEMLPETNRSNNSWIEAVQLSACETLTHVSMCSATKRSKQVSEEEDKDDGANLPEYVHHFRW